MCTVGTWRVTWVASIVLIGRMRSCSVGRRTSGTRASLPGSPWASSTWPMASPWKYSSNAQNVRNDVIS